MLQGVEQRGCRFLAGLAQGCPLSCLVYVICVDPLLKFLSQQPHISGVSGFVDDWSVACQGVASVDHILAIIETFERASGQRINYDMSKLVPSRRLTAAEMLACQTRWPDLRVSYRERLLGLFLGLHATMADQFAQPLHKFEQALADYERRRSELSLCARVTVANVFLLSLFAFPCRHFYMPSAIIQRVDNALLRFFARIPFAKLGLFAHLTSLYGTRVQLRDLRLSNVAMLLSSYQSNAPALATVREHFCGWARTSPTRRTLRAIGTKPGRHAGGCDGGKSGRPSVARCPSPVSVVVRRAARRRGRRMAGLPWSDIDMPLSLMPAGEAAALALSTSAATAAAAAAFS